MPNPRRLIFEPGTKFNKLTVIEAQTMVLVNTDCLVGGFTKTCGCSRDDNGLKRRITNRYEFRDDFVIGYTQKGRPFFVSIEDHDLIKEYCWVESHGYVVTRGRDGKIIRLHRFIMDAPPGDFVDHINHDCFDNRRCNLRIVDPLKSLWNRGIREDSQCSVKGVYMADGKWIARITVYKKEITLGRFDTLEEAKAAREAAEIHYFGDLSYEKSIAAVPRIEDIPWKEPIERYATSSAADAAAIEPVADAAADVAADPDATAPSPT